MTKPVWITTAGFLTTASELVSFSTSLQAMGTGITYTLISGGLHSGLTFNNGVISGVPTAVVNTQRKKFVVRATNVDGVSDRTFFLDVEGPDDPVWSTSAGYLPVGYNDEAFCFDRQFIDVSVAAEPIAPASTLMRYYIADNDGTLPLGINLDESGRISGIVEENLIPGGPPKKFIFYVTATDGVSSSRRQFQFIVVPPDFFRVDNTYLNFSSTFVTSATTIAAITSGTFTLTTATIFGSNLDLGLLAVEDLVIANTSSVKSGTKIADIVSGIFTINSATTATVNPGTVFTFRRPNVLVDFFSGFITPNSYSYLQPLQFLNGTDLGEFRADNNDDINIQAYDPAPFRGPVSYSLVTGTTIATQLPEGLSLDSEQGYIYGFIPYQPAYTRDYELTIQATKTDNYSGTKVTATNTFTMAIKGEVESSIEWVTGSDLGSIETGTTSEIQISARQIKSEYTIKYQLQSGSLPQGLTLARDGSICGQAEYGSTGTYTFTILASDVYELSWIQKQFQLTVTESTAKQYTKIYYKPFLSLDKRTKYREFTTNEFTFDPSLIYRYYDPAFGVQPEIKMILEFGIEQVDLAYYVSALRENFYRKRLYFGDIKKAIARNADKEVVYEVIYVDIVDDMTNNKNISANHTIYTNNDIYYPGSVDNQRRQLSLIPLEDNTYISIRDDLQPRFMNTFQQGEYTVPGYLRVVPICYALPGQGSKIINRIKLSGFDFKQFDFEIDRITVENSADNNSAKYLIFDRQSLGDSIETDDYLFGLDWAEVPELTVRLDDENDNPINRK